MRTMAPERGRALLADYLVPLADSLLDPRLFRRTALSRCLRVAGAVPGEATFGMLGFELRLDHDSALDLLVCASRKAGGPGWLRAMTEVWASGQPTSPWRAIAAFARTWETDRLRDRVDHVWLEFDCAKRPLRGAASLPVAGVFTATQSANNGSRVQDSNLSAAVEVLELLHGEPLAPALLAMLMEIEKALPGGSRIFQVGSMLGRRPPSIRVCVYGPGPDAIRMVLRRLGWTGPIQEVEHLLASLGELPRSICVDLDIDIESPGLGGTVGIEVYATGPGELADASQWRPLLSHLEGMKLVTPVKQAVLATYPRVQASTELLDRLPEQYAQAATLLAAQRAGRFATHIHHVKISASDRGQATAKAYLSFWHEWS
jgi:hypothetical protein